MDPRRRTAFGGAALSLMLALAGCGAGGSGTASPASAQTSAAAPVASASGTPLPTSTPVPPTPAPTPVPVPPTPSPSRPPATPAAALSTVVLPRSTADRPDDHTGSQVHVVYAIPSDGQDQHRDTDGEIVRSLHAIETWFRQQSGGVLRVDTSHGALDITFVRLPESDATLAALGANAVDHITADLVGLNFVDPQKLYAVFYEGGDSSACGSTPTPSSVAAEYLDGTPPGAAPCNTNPVGADANVPGYIEFGMLHEIVHALGFVADCAPHSTGNNHVGNNPHDLMYAGDQPWDPSQLDPAHTDYFRTGSKTCPDLADSPFLDLPASH